jgi:hypothetical protein
VDRAAATGGVDRVPAIAPRVDHWRHSIEVTPQQAVTDVLPALRYRAGRDAAKLRPLPEAPDYRQRNMACTESSGGNGIRAVADVIEWTAGNRVDARPDTSADVTFAR